MISQRAVDRALKKANARNDSFEYITPDSVTVGQMVWLVTDARREFRVQGIQYCDGRQHMIFLAPGEEQSDSPSPTWTRVHIGQLLVRKISGAAKPASSSLLAGREEMASFGAGSKFPIRGEKSQSVAGNDPGQAKRALRGGVPSAGQSASEGLSGEPIGSEIFPDRGPLFINRRAVRAWLLDHGHQKVTPHTLRKINYTVALYLRNLQGYNL